MKINTDYTLANKAMIVGKNKMDNAKGIFIGTKNYFFFFPEKSFGYNKELLQNTLTTSELYYNEKPLNRFVLEKLQEPELSIAEFESFVVEELKLQIPEVKIEAILAVNQFKAEAKWYYSAITINKSKINRKWEPFAMQFKKDKNDVRLFYLNHQKLVS